MTPLLKGPVRMLNVLDIAAPSMFSLLAAQSCGARGVACTLSQNSQSIPQPASNQPPCPPAQQNRPARLDRMCSDIDLGVVYPTVEYTPEEYLAVRRRLGILDEPEEP
eukprot:jgi/Chrzof1/1107/Cz01g40110.t1